MSRETVCSTRSAQNFAEMPGLLLTRCQFQRLWELDADTCTDAIDVLVKSRFLVRQPDGQYCVLGRFPENPGMTVHAHSARARRILPTQCGLIREYAAAVLVLGRGRDDQNRTAAIFAWILALRTATAIRRDEERGS